MLSLLVITQAFRDSFDVSAMRWPGPVVGAKLSSLNRDTGPFVPVVFSSADAVYRPGTLAHQTFYSVETEEEIGLLLRLLHGFAPHEQSVSPPATCHQRRTGAPDFAAATA
jgi:hypothetical protein